MENGRKYVLVTGGAGFIGSHTVIELFEKGFYPIILDDFRNSQKDVIDRLTEITKKEIIYFPFACQDEKKVTTIFEKYDIYGIIHFAAYKAVSESIQLPLKYLSNNIESLLSILKVAQQYTIKQFVFSSSCTVYGNPKVIPVEETFPTTFLTPYGFTKKSGEEILTQYVDKFPDTQITILRYFNPIGAHESGLIGEEPIGPPNNLLPYITQTVAGIRKELTIFGNDYSTPDGTCIRDYIHVMDLAAAHVLALQSTEAKKNPIVYNVGTGNGRSVLSILKSFEKVSGKKIPFHFGEKRAGDIPEIYAVANKINHDLGWEAKRTVEEAIADAWKFEQFIRTKRNDYEKN